MSEAPEPRVRRWMVVVGALLLAGAVFFALTAILGDAVGAWTLAAPMGLGAIVMFFAGVAAPLARRGATQARARRLRVAGVVVLGVAALCAAVGAFHLHTASNIDDGAAPYAGSAGSYDPFAGDSASNLDARYSGDMIAALGGGAWEQRQSAHRWLAGATLVAAPGLLLFALARVARKAAA